MQHRLLNGKLHANMYYYYSSDYGTCQAHFGEILFTMNNNTLEIPSAAYTTKWEGMSGTEPAACPATTLTLTVSPLNEQESNGYKGYEFKISEANSSEENRGDSHP